MTVVYVIDHLRGDGTQRFLTTLTKNLAVHTQRQVVIVLKDSFDEHVVERLRQAGVAIYFIGKRSLLLGYGLLRILLLLREIKPDVVVTFLLYSELLGKALARISRVPRIVGTIRVSNKDLSFFSTFFLRLAYSISDVVIVNSKGLVQEAKDIYRIPEEKTVLIPNWVEVDRSGLISKEGLLRELQIPDGSQHKIFITAGRLEFQKGIDLLIRSIAKIDDDCIHLVIFGDGSERDRLIKLAIDLGVENRVHFMGYRVDAYRYFTAGDFYVQASRYEGLSNATLEAVALGCPVIASRIEGSQELEEYGGSTVFFENENIKELIELLDVLPEVEKIASAIKNPLLRKKDLVNKWLSEFSP